MDPLPTRRLFLSDLGKGVAAAFVLAACAADPGASSATSGPTAPPSTGAEPPGGTTAGSTGTTTGAAGTTTATPEGELAWARANLGFVSAYVLVRSGEAAVVDTGVSGSADAIEAVLTELGLEWADAGHVILTHEHRDHVGSLQAVLDRATGATGYAAEPDIRNITTPRPLTPVADGDLVFGLQVVATPGHTAGHISILDPGRLLVAGDAINGFDGVSGPNPAFTSDMPAAIESARRLGGLAYTTAVFGHGEPLTSEADVRVAAMAAAL
jgi:glyoxylase-like metal-dependent hydrolase (beta-lactamase superfamily II)